MPTLFEYFGIKIRFYSSEHLPVHIHAFYAGKYGMKVEFILKDGKIINKKYKQIKRLKKFQPAQLRDLKKLVNKYQEIIIKEWINYFVKNKKVKKRVISQRLN